MKFQTEDQNDIKWMDNPDGYLGVAEEIRMIKGAGRWEDFLAQNADENGVVDCDALYDYLRHDGPRALLSVGLHYNEGTATVMDVVKAWKEEHKDEGVRVSYMADGKTPSGLQLFNYGKSFGTDLMFESVNEDGEVEEVSLDSDEVLELVGDKANGNANTGAWTGIDPDTAVFEMWRDE